jgi:hypothetical protein
VRASRSHAAHDHKPDDHDATGHAGQVASRKVGQSHRNLAVDTEPLVGHAHTSSKEDSIWARPQPSSERAPGVQNGSFGGAGGCFFPRITVQMAYRPPRQIRVPRQCGYRGCVGGQGARLGAWSAITVLGSRPHAGSCRGRRGGCGVMGSEELSPADGATPAAQVGEAEDLRLLRRYEPVLRFTRGELFLPMRVDGLPRVFRTGNPRLVHAATSWLRYSS